MNQGTHAAFYQTDRDAFAFIYLDLQRYFEKSIIKDDFMSIFLSSHSLFTKMFINIYFLSKAL